MRKLRPAKVRSAVHRRWFERRLGRTTGTPVPGLEDIGTPYGGWAIPGQLIDDSWLCYSVGAGGDVSFDVALIDRYGATVRSIEPVAAYVQSARESAAGRERFSAHQAAIATVDGPIRMQLTHHQGSQSLSAAGLYDTDRYVEVPGRTLESLMAELGDDHIDLLKLDIEGSEYDVVPTLDLPALGVRVFATQLHHTASVPKPGSTESPCQMASIRGESEFDRLRLAALTRFGAMTFPRSCCSRGLRAAMTAPGVGGVSARGRGGASIRRRLAARGCGRARG